MRNALSRVAPLFSVVLLVAGDAGFAAHDDTSSVAGLCSIIPVATFRDGSISYFVATAKADTVFAGPGQVRPSIEGGHWGPASNRAIYGQIVTIHRLEGANAADAESAFAGQGSREAVVVPWDYDPACQPVPWARSARWVTNPLPGFYRARLRASVEWIDGRPTYDAFHADIEPYPHGKYFERGYRNTDSAQAPGALTASEYFDLYSALPDLAEARCDPEGALARLVEWEARHPDQARRFPATRVLRSARNAITYRPDRR